MFAIIEAYEAIGADNDDSSSTCLTHTENRESAEKVFNEARQLGFDFRIERYAYFLEEFQGECPNCGRSFEF